MNLLGMPWYIYCGVAAFIGTLTMAVLGKKMPFKMHRNLGIISVLLMVAHILGALGIF